MSTAGKALIITWVAIGFLVVGGAGFYIGRITAKQPNPQQMNQQGAGFMQPSGQSSNQQQLPAPSGFPSPSGAMKQQPSPPPPQPSGFTGQGQQPAQQQPRY